MTFQVREQTIYKYTNQLYKTHSHQAHTSTAIVGTVVCVLVDAAIFCTLVTCNSIGLFIFLSTKRQKPHNARSFFQPESSACNSLNQVLLLFILQYSHGGQTSQPCVPTSYRPTDHALSLSQGLNFNIPLDIK